MRDRLGAEATPDQLDEPLRRESRAAEQEAARWKDRLAALKRQEPRDHGAVTEAEARLGELAKQGRELDARAEAIDHAVYDLKAVNPHVKNDEDTRSPEELLDLIEAKGREVAEALAVLRAGTNRPA